MQLFYYSQISGSQLQLDKTEARHMTKVLRKSVGDKIHITDGKGNLFFGTIDNVSSNKVFIDLAFAKAEKHPSPQLHVAIAPTKMNDRMEWFLEKSVEIGIQEVTPILCHHSERKKINLDRFEKIMISAMQQSNRLWLPRLNPLKTFQEFIESQNGQSLFVAHCEDTEKTYLNRALSPATDATILIGPEGDFSTAEVEQALEGGAKPVALGDSRLRTETAAVYAVTAFNLAQIP